MEHESVEYWIVPHTHWDREWYLTFQDFRWRLVKAIDEVLDTLGRDSSFHHFMLDGQTVVVDDYLELRSERRTEIEALVRAGRIAVGPWLVQPDDLLASGEALIRNLETGLARARELGGGMMVGHLPDSFGHIGSLPAILRGFGIESACLMRGPGRGLDRVLFGWTAKEGSRVLVVNLVDGYGNGADLTAEAASIDEALSETKARQAGTCLPGIPILLMDGFDHRPIDARLPAALAASSRPGAARIGSLEGYLDAAAASLHGLGAGVAAGPERGASLPEWRGELRSVYRAPINAGCISIRHWIKREDQQTSLLLERRAEPLAALASLLGAPYPYAALAAAWRQLLLNQAHDSICGCSIDAVHEDMKFRYAQSRGLAENIAADGAARLAAEVRPASAAPPAPSAAALPAAGREPLGARKGGEPFVIVAVNPSSAREAPLLEFQAADAPDHPVLEDGEGRRYPAQLLAPSGEPSLFFDERFAPSQIRFAMGLVRHGEIMSLRVQDARVSWESEGVLRVELRLSDASVHSGFDWDRWVAESAGLLKDKRVTAVHAVGRRAGMSTVLFQAPVPSFGAAAFVVRERSERGGAPPGESAAPEAPPLIAKGRTLENPYFRVCGLSDGSLDLVDKASGILYRGIGRLVDSGDRGDEYNFDALPGDRSLSSPARSFRRPSASRIRLVESGPVRAMLRIDSIYRIPEGLVPGRLQRTRRLTELEVVKWVSLTARGRRVEMRIEVDNRARDHRLRVHFPLPGVCSESEAGGTFEIVKRPARPAAEEALHGPAVDLMHEAPPASHPFSGFVGARWRKAEPAGNPDGDALHGIALLARGMREYEILHTPSGSEIALTLFRSVGWLSRGDLFVRNDQAGPDVETPAAQEIGRWRFECAVTTYRGELAESDLPSQWEDYCSPLEVRPAGAPAAGHGAPADGRLSLLGIEGEGICFSSLRRTPAGSLALRFYDLLGRRRQAAVKCGIPLARARRTRIDGKPVTELPLEGDGRLVRLSLAPYEIVTLELDPAP